MKATMDRAGRLVIPKEIRREAVLVPGVPMATRERQIAARPWRVM